MFITVSCYQNPGGSEAVSSGKRKKLAKILGFSFAGALGLPSAGHVEGELWG